MMNPLSKILSIKSMEILKINLLKNRLLEHIFSHKKCHNRDNYIDDKLLSWWTFDVYGALDPWSC